MNHNINIVGHRGDFYKEIENTYESISSAFKFVDACEIDVQFTLDKKLVLFHDEYPETLGFSLKEKVNIPITDLTYEELQEAVFKKNILEQSLTKKAGKSIQLKSSFPKIALLEDLNPLLIGNKKLIVELKNFKQNLERKARFVKEICKWILENNFLEKIVVISFDKECLEMVRKFNSDIQLGLDAVNAKSKNLNEEIFFCDKTKIDYLLPPMVETDKEIVEFCRKNGLKIYSWVFKENQEEEVVQVQNMIKLPVDGVIINQPEKISKLCKKLLY